MEEPLDNLVYLADILLNTNLHGDNMLKGQTESLSTCAGPKHTMLSQVHDGETSPTEIDSRVRFTAESNIRAWGSEPV